MQVVPFNSFIIKDKLHNHSLLKPQILNLIEESKDTSDSGVDSLGVVYADHVSKLDWDNSKDLNRKWVQLFLPGLNQQLRHIATQLGFANVILYDLWYQQYIENDKHGWHIHGNNFTCVYYLELPKEAPRTELIDPLTKDILVQDVNEGDLIIFPSFTIHRAPVIKNNFRKTIISFNIDFSGIIHPIK